MAQRGQKEMFSDGKHFTASPQIHRKYSLPPLEHVKTVHPPPQTHIVRSCNNMNTYFLGRISKKDFVAPLSTFKSFAPPFSAEIDQIK